jgi:hypothetical protein
MLIAWKRVRKLLKCEGEGELSVVSCERNECYSVVPVWPTAIDWVLQLSPA